MGKLLYGPFAEKENRRWFWARSSGGLYFKDILNGDIALTYIDQKENVIRNETCLFEHIILFDDFCLLVPRYAEEIPILNLEQNKVVKRILLEGAEGCGEYFLGAIQTEQQVILIPLSYHKIVHINKQSLQVRTGDFHYGDYCNENQLYSQNNLLHFRAFPVIHENNIYLPFYDFSRILIYNIDSTKYLVCNTQKIESMDKLEIYESDEIKLLIIERLDCLRIEEMDKSFLSLLDDFLHKHRFLRMADYGNNAYLLMEDGIYVLEKGKNRIKIVDWFSQVRADYLNRVHDQEGDRLQDTLYVFQNEGILYITFELEEHKYIIRICMDKVSIEYEKIENVDEISLLWKALKFNSNNQNILPGNCAGKVIYQSLS